MSYLVNTGAAVHTRVGAALVNVHLAVVTTVTVRTLAAVGVDRVRAGAAVLARGAVALIDVVLTVVPSIPSYTRTFVESKRRRCASAAVLARVGDTMNSVIGTLSSLGPSAT